MKRNISSVLLVVALFAGLATPACATEGDYFNQPGPYVGLAAAGGLSEFQGRSHGFGNSAGFNLRGGYRFNDYLAAEGLYEYMDEFDGRSLLSGVPAKSDFLTHNFSLMGKVILPTLGITRLQPYLGAGVGFLNANGSTKFALLGRQGRGDASDTEFAGRVDGGVDYFLTPAISTFFDLGYVMPTSHLSEVTYLSLSLGAKYRF